MTKEQAADLLDNLIGFVEDNHGSDYDEALKIAIKALKQEPCEDAISRQTLKDIDRDELLDMIRAEIENDWQLKKYPSSPFSCGLRRAIEIIDKYKAESEESNGTL